MKTKPHGYGPHDPRRCQAVEQRRVNDRNRAFAHVHAVQCSLDRHGDEIEHEWHGRKFGQTTKPQTASRQPWRCTETEIRNVSRSGKPDLRKVRCTLPLHEEQIEHEHRGRKFGAPLKRSSSGPGGRPIRCAATEQRNVSKNKSDGPRWLEVQCSLKPHGDEIEHEWMGRRFGKPMRRNGSKYRPRPKKPWRLRRIHDARWRAEQGLPPLEQTSVGKP